jgi:PAS domain S-box-containing protein
MTGLKDKQVNRTDFKTDMPQRTPDQQTVKFPKTEHLALALKATSDGIWVWDIDTGDAFFSNQYYRMLGYEPDEFPAHYDSWVGLLHPNDLEKTQAMIQKHIENQSESYEVEFRLRAKTGDWVWILGRGNVVEWDDDGHPLRLVGSHVNIDTRKRAEEKLAEYQKQLEAMVKERTIALEQTSSLLEATFDAIPDVLGVQDGQHHIIRYNAAGYAFLNMSHEEVEGKRCFELIGRKKECDICATSLCYQTKKPASVERYEEALDVWLDVRAYPIFDDEGNLVKVIEHLRDITANKKAEAENRKLHKQLQNTQKIEALGTLAGGIAHDFNNLLMSIQGRISLLAVDMVPSDPAGEHIDAIEEYIRSATNLTKQLLGFARGGKYEVKPIDLNKLVTMNAAMFGRTRKDMQIHVKTSARNITVDADRRQIDHVLLNIFINAWQAMGSGGRMYIETDVDTLDETFCAPYNSEPGRYARISITDTGVGMDKSVREKIFDPFFTTKQKERGTGLGLASAYGIIKNHDGFINVYSQVGQGTTFNIFLPVSEKTAYEEPAADKKLVKGNETVLLVDDEQAIIDVCQAMLKKLGYRVYAALSGVQAIDTVKERMNDIDLVILDLIMPGMDGGQVFDVIRSMAPAIPVILSSGYAINGQANRVMQKGCEGFIQKPFNFAQLSQAIRKILDNAH